MSIPNPVGTYPFHIKSYDADFKGRVTLEALFHYLQEVAWENARSNNFGYEFMQKEHAYWVLSKVRLELELLPQWNEDIKVQTWPKGGDGFFAFRDFLLHNEQGIFGRAASHWLIVDQQSKRPKKVNNYFFSNEHYCQDNALPDATLAKLSIAKDLAETEEKRVHFSDLDVNQHVNNATYVKWCLDALPMKRVKNCPVQSIEINYLAELLGGETIEIGYLQEGAKYLIAIYNKATNRPVCVAEITLQETCTE